MQLTSIWQMTAAYWANLTVRMSIDRMEWDCWVYYYLQLADTLKYILQGIFICIIEEQCIDEGESTWRRYKGCQNTIHDILVQIKWWDIVDTPMAKGVSMERRWFLVLHHWLSAWRTVVAIHQCDIGWLSRQKREPHTPCPILNMRVNDFWSCIIGNLNVDWLRPFINVVLAGFIGKRESNTLPAPFWIWASMECQRSLVL